MTDLAQRLPCPHCQKRFCDTEALWQHRRSSHGETDPRRPFACPACQRVFISADGLSHHAGIKHVQPVQPVQPVRAARKGRAQAPLHPPGDDEESLAEIAIEAAWKRAAGLPLDELEASLLP